MYVIACLFFLRNATGFMQVLIGLCLVGFCYGGYLAMMPSFTADYYGAKNVGANYGIVFTAWGVCGFTVPKYFAGIMKAAKEAVMSAIGIALVLIVKRPIHEVGTGGGEA
jgi:OFA family oxalate/formate antiporter-like MFS transporter